MSRGVAKNEIGYIYGFTNFMKDLHIHDTVELPICIFFVEC